MSSFKVSLLSLIPFKKEVEGRNILTPKTPSSSLGTTLTPTCHSLGAFLWRGGQKPPAPPKEAMMNRIMK